MKAESLLINKNQIKSILLILLILISHLFTLQKSYAEQQENTESSVGSNNRCTGYNPLVTLFANNTFTATPGEFDHQTFKTGNEAIVERLIVLGFINAGVKGLTKIENFKHNNGVFTIDFGEGSSMSFFVNVYNLPESLDNLNENSVKLIARTPRGIEKGGLLAMTFEVGDSNYEIDMSPATHEKDLLVELMERIDGIFKVEVTDDGWLLIHLDNGTALSLYYDYMHNKVSTSTGDGITFELPIDHGYDNNDVNGDGMMDIILIYNGIAQLLLFKPI